MKVKLTFDPQDYEGHSVDCGPKPLTCEVLVPKAALPPDESEGEYYELRDALREYGPSWWRDWPLCYGVYYEVLGDDDTPIEALLAVVDEDRHCGMLDELVHDTASLVASDTNNGGIEEQLRYLLAEGVEASHICAVLGIEL